ncbi:hypothetical protein B9Z19DRAFT_1102938 [Tuber borchii]|uniref:Uncharacterized protein n=1 Tax=Tuber borchii TaxID=42251 RepID=A0A2T6ZJ41_TUBBO|nr:hypothetical protein B9Z19DRAFT_1102938 [Tuber borchii]
MTSTDQDTFTYRYDGPPINRTAYRNLFIYDSDNHDTVLGGLWVAEGVTNTNLYSMADILCIFTNAFDLQDDKQCLVERNEQPLRPGNYYIVTNGSISVTNEVPLLRTLSTPSGTRVESFFHSITVPPASESDGSINSVQNGILLTLDTHILFDCYDFSINPDDGYKIVCFSPLASHYGIAGRQLDQRLLDDPLRPVDQLFRWHFRQAVLTNMKGAGEVFFEMDFPPDSDMMGQIMSGPRAAERLEFELFTRLNRVEGQCSFINCLGVL